MISSQHNLPTTKQLDALPTLIVGHVCDLKIEVDEYRFWLSRCDTRDGEPFDNTVYVEERIDGVWLALDHYDGDKTITCIGNEKMSWITGMYFLEEKKLADQIIGEN